MDPNNRKPQTGPEAGLQEIPKWARRYAQNRTLPALASLVISAAAFLGLWGLSLLTGWAYKSGERLLGAVGILILTAFSVWWVWFCLAGGIASLGRIAERLYRGEGGAIATPSQVRVPTRLPLAVFVFMVCVPAQIGLASVGLLPIRLMQPISALYVVPFMWYVGRKLRGVGSPFMFLWPALYGIHAILIVVGAPIGLGPAFDIIVPTFGYGLVAALAGHIYSRIALRRLRALAAGQTPADQHQNGTDARA